MGKKYLLIRCKPHNIKREEEFSKGIISIGWPTGFSFEGFTRLDLESKLPIEYSNNKTTITQIENFINISPGDIIITPLENKTLLIFEAISNYKYISEKDSNDIGNPHTILAKLKIILEKYPEELNGVIKASRRAVTNLNNYKEIIEKILDPSLKTDVDIMENNIKLALDTLKDLLNSNESEIKLQAALGILTHYKNKL